MIYCPRSSEKCAAQRLKFTISVRESAPVVPSVARHPWRTTPKVARSVQWSRQRRTSKVLAL